MFAKDLSNTNIFATKTRSLIIKNIYCLCLGAFVAIVSGLSGSGFRLGPFAPYQGKILPGLRIPWGSNRPLIFFIQSRLFPCSASMNCLLPIPTPCSPVAVPPKLMALNDFLRLVPSPLKRNKDFKAC